MVFGNYQYNKSQYVKTEEILHYINRKYISMDDDDIRNANSTLRQFLDVMICTMKRINPLFANMYETILYGGSFYDGLKVGQPDEFDIDLKLRLPNILNVQIILSKQPGFVHVKLQDWIRLERDRYLYSLFRDLEVLKDEDNNLIQSHVMAWMLYTVQKAVQIINKENLLPNISITSYGIHGPAVTLKIYSVLDHKQIDIDLVAVFRINESKWPEKPYRRHHFALQQDFYVVPKPPNPEPKNDNRHIYWRLSFQQQEQELLNGYYFCKPALRLLKKLRDTRTHNIPSYFIKTIFLWKLQEEDGSFWDRSLNFVFMEMLETYKNHMKKGKIPYYWNENYNLLQTIKPETITNIKNFLQRMIDMIHKNIETDLFIAAKFILQRDEYFMVYYHFNPTFIPESAAIRFLTAEEMLYNKFVKELNRPYETGSTFLRYTFYAICVAIFYWFLPSLSNKS